MARNLLEETLERITRDFVHQIVVALRTASFADVAALEVAASAAPAPRANRGAQRVTATPRRRSAEAATPPEGDRSAPVRTRQTADRRAELAERVLKALEGEGRALGVRALSSELGVAADLLAAPLRDLRAAGKIAKHGEKRATTYSLAG